MSKLSKLQKQNDAFRKGVLLSPQENGICVIGAEIDDLEDQQKSNLFAAVAKFSEFDMDIDPYHEHDFGIVELPGIPKVMWKIDYYADDSCTFGAQDPSEDCYRVLSIIYASQY